MSAMSYVAKFDRIARNHNVEPLMVSGSADDIAAQVLRYARPKCGSRDILVNVDMDEMRGRVYTGMRNAGAFTLEAVVADPVPEQSRKRFAELTGLADDPEWLGI